MVEGRDHLSDAKVVTDVPGEPLQDQNGQPILGHEETVPRQENGTHII